MIEVGTAGKTTFPYHGFQFMSEATLLPSGISLDIKCIETDQMIIVHSFMTNQITNVREILSKMR